jgi:pentatricopeptide repeat protein
VAELNKKRVDIYLSTPHMLALKRTLCANLSKKNYARKYYHRRHDSSSTLRIQPGVQPDVAFQKNMNQTARARSAMQLMAAGERGQYASCLAIAAKMKKEGIPPDYSTYIALLQAAGRGAHWLDAWAIFDDMLLVGIEPTANIFNHLLHVCHPTSIVSCPYVWQAQRSRSSLYVWPVIEKMNEMNITPNAATFSFIIDRYTTAGNLELALQYLHSMKAHNLVPELPAVEAIVTLTADRGYPRLAIDLATWFEDTSIRRLDQAVWMSCLRSSADSLYVSPSCKTYLSLLF